MVAKLQGIKVEIEDQIDPLKKIAKNEKEVKSFFLFGSYGEGRQTPLSDVDIAFLPSDNLSSKGTEQLDKNLYRKLSRLFGSDDITLVNLKEAPIMLAHNILKGKLLFCRDRKDLAEYKEKILETYPEVKKMRDSLSSAYFKRLRKKKNDGN